MIQEWIDVVNDIYVMERISFWLHLQKDAFVKLWTKWVRYVRPLRTDFVEVTNQGLCDAVLSWQTLFTYFFICYLLFLFSLPICKLLLFESFSDVLIDSVCTLYLSHIALGSAEDVQLFFCQYAVQC